MGGPFSRMVVIWSSASPPAGTVLGDRHRHARGRGGSRCERRLLGHLAREAEVHDANLAVAADHHVVGLEVPVHEPLFVRGGEAAPRRPEDPQDLLPAAGLRCQPVGDGVPLDELHRDEDLIVERPHVVDHDDVRVREPGDRLRLAQRPLPPLGQRDAVAGLDPQELDRDLSVQLRIVGGVDLPHPAAPDQAEHDVAANRRAPDERRRGMLGGWVGRGVRRQFSGLRASYIDGSPARFEAKI